MFVMYGKITVAPTAGGVSALGTHITADPLVIDATPFEAPTIQPGAKGSAATPLSAATGRYMAATAVVPASFTFCHGCVASIRESNRNVMS
jgi:hypothetical protein